MLRVPGGNKRSLSNLQQSSTNSASSSTAAAASLSSPTAAAVPEEEEIPSASSPSRRTIDRSNPNLRSVWMNLPNPNSTIAETEQTTKVRKADTASMREYIIHDPMGQPDNVVAAINTALRNSNDPDSKLIATNIVVERYKTICTVVQGKKAS